MRPLFPPLLAALAGRDSGRHGDGTISGRPARAHGGGLRVLAGLAGGGGQQNNNHRAQTNLFRQGRDCGRSDYLRQGREPFSGGGRRTVTCSTQGNQGVHIRSVAVSHNVGAKKVSRIMNLPPDLVNEAEERNGATQQHPSIYKFPVPRQNGSQSPKLSAPRKQQGTFGHRHPPRNASPPSPSKPRHVISSIPCQASEYLLSRRLLLPTCAVPSAILVVPALSTFALSSLAYIVGVSNGLLSITTCSLIILAATFGITKVGKSMISRHAPNKEAEMKALRQSFVALPFWSMVICLVVMKVALSMLDIWSGGSTDSRGWMSWLVGIGFNSLFWSAKVAMMCVRPASAWLLLSLSIRWRYSGWFCPIGACADKVVFALSIISHDASSTARCSGVPLRANPFDATLQKVGRNFTSKERFLDAIARGLDRLSAPSSSRKPDTNSAITQTERLPFSGFGTNTKSTQPATTLQQRTVSGGPHYGARNPRYSRPGILTVLVQALVSAVIGMLFAAVFVRPFLHPSDDVAIWILNITCTLAPILELFANGMNESELHFGHYSLLLDGSGLFVVQMMKDVGHRMKRNVFGLRALAVIIAVVIFMTIDRPAIAPVTHASSWSLAAMVVMASVMAVQDVLTRWCLCAPGLDGDVLLFNVLGGPVGNAKKTKFLTEDLIIQGILRDGTTVDQVIKSSTVSRHGGYQEDELARNKIACTAYANWIQESSTVASGKLSDDILRMCLLESLGGGGPSPSAAGPYFGGERHTGAIRKRLGLSAASASGTQPFIVPIVRCLCAFSGGLGDSMTALFRTVDENGTPLRLTERTSELWKLPPGSLDAAKYAIKAAARIAVMNSTLDREKGPKKDELLSLQLPCILQSAFKLRCGLHVYAKAVARLQDVSLSTDQDLGEFIHSKCPELLVVVEACDESARMAKKAILRSGDRSSEAIFGWKGDMKSYLAEL